MTWEALNNISDDNSRNLVIVVNDFSTGAHTPLTIGAWHASPTTCALVVYRSFNASSRRFSTFGAPGQALYLRYPGRNPWLPSAVSSTTRRCIQNLDIKYIGRFTVMTSMRWRRHHAG
jgi:1-deoxy-D-xylulose-5-phosphate synthase